jgi:hypothetical protein
MPDLYILYLDRYHLGDDLFIKSMAQRFSQGPAGEPFTLIVHGSGEKVERTLEAEGLFPDRREGVLDVETDEQRRLVERAVREANQELVGTMTDEVVSTVGVQGVDRSLLQATGDGVEAGTTGWLEALIKQRVVAVVSALVRREGAVREVWTADAATALARGLEGGFDVSVVFLTRSDRPGLAAEASGDDGTAEAAPPADVTDDDVPEPDAVARVARAGVPVLVTNLDGFFAEGGPTGTRIRAGESA